jgi:hypothetical protein
MGKIHVKLFSNWNILTNVRYLTYWGLRKTKGDGESERVCVCVCVGKGGRNKERQIKTGM